MKLKQSKVFKAGIGYTIGNVMVKGINFLAIPIFSRLLTTEEMGLYTVFAVSRFSTCRSNPGAHVRNGI